MKAKVEKILNKVWGWASCGLEQPERDYKKEEFINQASSSLTTLIIKWLEEKRKPDSPPAYLAELYTGYNQLITELIGELR